jgi:quercetin dioxygenase-like cupin family protein
MDPPRLEQWDSADGPLTEKRMIHVLEHEGYEVAVYAYREGTVFAEHAHAQDKCHAVLDGTFRITIAGVALDLKAGDRLYLPSQTRHAAEVVGRKTVLSLDGTKWA